MENNVNENHLVTWVVKIIVITLCLIVLASIVILLSGLFDHNVDNNKVFEILGPALSTIIGSFVGLLGGISINFKTKNSNNKEQKDNANPLA